MRWFLNKNIVKNIAMSPNSTEIPMRISCQFVKTKLENSTDPSPQKKINCFRIVLVLMALLILYHKRVSVELSVMSASIPLVCASFLPPFFAFSPSNSHQ